MTDREKVVKQFMHLLNAAKGNYQDFVDLTVDLGEEIAALLKEQEAVEPTFKQGEDGVFVWACGSCGAYMYHIYDGIDKAKEYAKYCRQCGKKVKWE
jgi:hypothetical protein